MKISFFNKLLSLIAQPAAIPANNTAEFDTLTTDKAIAEVTSVVDSVDDVINVINDISAQIKFMTKNAAIESARAREYGKDFMMFSSEMEALSKSASKNAQAISNSLQSITAQIQNAKIAGQNSLDALANIQKEVDVFADAFSDISHAPASLSEGTT
jgi:methyl-accepting chemotaxis protein